MGKGTFYFYAVTALGAAGESSTSEPCCCKLSQISAK